MATGAEFERQITGLWAGHYIEADWGAQVFAGESGRDTFVGWQNGN